MSTSAAPSVAAPRLAVAAPVDAPLSFGPPRPPDSLLRCSTVLLFVCLLVVDGCSAILVAYSSPGNSKHGAEALDPGAWGPFTDRENTGTDLVVLFMVRLALIFACAAVAVYRFRTLPLPSASLQAKPTPQEESDKLILNSAHHTNELGHTESSTRHAAWIDEARARVTIRERFEWTQRIIMAVIFVVLTACNIYVATKALIFNFSWDPYQEVFVGLGVVWINLELLFASYVTRELIQTMAADVENKEIHRHALSFVVHSGRVKCDLCGERIKEDYFKCEPCDFDLCMACFKKSSKDHASHSATRTDKGIVDVEIPSMWAYFTKLVKLLHAFLHIVVVAVVCLIAGQVMKLFLPHFQGAVIDAVVRRHHDEFIDNVKLYGLLSLGLSLLGAVRALCSTMTFRLASKEIRTQLFASLLARDIAFFDGTSTGALNSRITNDARAMVTPLTTLLSSVLQNVILLVGSATMCLIVCWKLAMLSLTVVGPVVVVMDVYARFSKRLNRRIWDAYADATDASNQAFSNIRTVKAFSSEEKETKKFNESLSEMIARAVQDALATAGSYIISEVLELGSMTLILGFGGMMAIKHPHQLTVGNIVTFQLYANMMSNAYFGLNNVFNQFTRSAGAAERILQMLDTPTSIDPEKGEKLTSFNGAVGFRNITFRYQMRPKQTILNNLSMDCVTHGVTAIVGPSGSGKSTLLHLLLRFYDPNSGEVQLDGKDLRQFALGSVHDATAVVAQDTQLFDTTILDNILYGLPLTRREEIVNKYDSQHSHAVDIYDERHEDSSQTATKPLLRGDDQDAKGKNAEQREKVEAAALFAAAVEASKRANAHTFISELEEGYHTKVGERGTRLSGGQKQRVAIARAFLRQPRLLLLDEATSALDAHSEAQVQAALDTLVQESHTHRCTVIIVAHRLSTVMNADRIVVVEGGEVREQGTHAELMEAATGLYRAFVAKGLQWSAGEGGSTTTAAAGRGTGPHGRAGRPSQGQGAASATAKDAI